MSGRSGWSSPQLARGDGIEGGRKRVSDTVLTEIVTISAFRDAQPLFLALFGVKTLHGTLLGPACNERGLRGEVGFADGLSCTACTGGQSLKQPAERSGGCSSSVI